MEFNIVANYVTLSVSYPNLSAPVPAGGAVQENMTEVLFIAFV